MRQGVYAMVGGPNYETVAELKMLRELGVDRNCKTVSRDWSVGRLWRSVGGESPKMTNR